MERNSPTPLWIVIPLASAISAHPPIRVTAMPTRFQPPETAAVTLTLECVDSANIRFELTNAGSTDTALPLGQGLANGRKYLISGLNLRMKPSNGNGTDYNYWPRDYRALTGGRFDRWFEALPAGASYRMSARLEDFWGFTQQDRFPRGIELSLRWTMSAETPKSLFPLVYWTGTLMSNSCIAP
jgi:hypothetical protein